MKRSVCSIAAVAALVIALPLATAHAADMMIYKAPPPSAPPVAVAGWGGCYVGGNFGGGWNRMNFDRVALADGTPAPADYGHQTASSVIGGGQVGCDYQINSQWVVGVKGQFDFADMNGQNILPAFPAFYMTDALQDIATVTGRLGYLIAPTWLVYAQGGGAWVHNGMNVFDIGPPLVLSESADADRYGYAAGGGVEYLIAPNWSVFAEYNYLGFGTRNVTFAPLGGGIGDVVSIKQNVQTAMLGVQLALQHACGPALVN